MTVITLLTTGDFMCIEKGKLDSILVNVVDISLFQPKRLSTTNNGLTISFSKGFEIPYPDAPVSG